MRVLAGRLAALFETDVEIVRRLNEAHHRLAAANDQLWLDPMPDAQAVQWQVHRAFCAYQVSSEQRRQLAVDVGEVAQQLTDALTAVGYTAEQARSANVDQLAAGTRPAADTPVSAPLGDVAL